MKPLLSKSQDNNSLQTLGRASVQIVHDLKNQLNGLKLYATFLRKRLEKGERPPDEMETVNKLISGLDRAASDLSTLVQYGRPIELRKQPGVDVQKIVRNVAVDLSEAPRATGQLTGSIMVDAEPTAFTGEFDPVLLAESFKSISVGAMKAQANEANGILKVSIKREAGDPDQVLIEWQGVNGLDHDPFTSFAGSDEIRMSLAAKVIEAHGGSAKSQDNSLTIRLPLTV